MNDQTLINVLFATSGALGGWWLKAMWAAILKLQIDQAAISLKFAESAVSVSNEYIKKEEFERFLDIIYKKLDRIEDKLDGKVDK
jgi:hypothetical protein